MLAWSSCMRRWRIRSEPVRWTSTLIPGYAASKSLATFSELDKAREVYQTTLPSFFAASRRASCAGTEAAERRTARAARLVASRRRVIASSAFYAPPHPVPLLLRGRGDRSGSLSLFDQEGWGE